MTGRPILDPGETDDPPRRGPSGRPSRSESTLDARTDRPLILVADDDPAIRSLLTRALGREGFETVVAANGRETIEQIAGHDIDVVLLDVHMPGMDGIETLIEIRADDRSRTLPIILITGTDGESDRVRGLESGADDFLAKPFALKELAARVRTQIRGRAA
jgi:DNA-binding response OmpR family regulator